MDDQEKTPLDPDDFEVDDEPEPKPEPRTEESEDDEGLLAELEIDGDGHIKRPRRSHETVLDWDE